MAFPSVVNTSTGATSTTDTTTHSITLPSSIVAGRLLLVVFSVDGAVDVSIDTSASGGKWVFLGQVANTTSVVTGAAYWKVAEGSDVLTLITSAAEQSSHVCYQISGANFAYGKSAAFGVVANTNPGGITMPDGSQDYLMFAARCGDGTGVASAAPANYTNLLNQAAAGANGASTSCAQRNVTGTSEDAGAFTSPSAGSISWTIAVTPVDYSAFSFPVVQATSKGVSTASDTTSHPITLPSGITAGDLLLVVFSSDENTADAADITISINTGVSGLNWAIGGQVANGNFNVKGAWVSKIAEGSDVLTLTTSTAQQSSHICFRISGGYSVTGTGIGDTGSTNSDPPSHTPPDGLQPYLWIATRQGDNTVLPTKPPEFFVNPINQVASGASGASTSTATRVFSASSLDPAVFVSATEQWVSWTLAVSPLAPPPEVVFPIFGGMFESRIFGGVVL